jgi:hypothetical protein
MIKFNISEKRFVVTKDFVKKQTDLQTIFFVNAPEIPKSEINSKDEIQEKSKNHSSMMLRVVIKNTQGDQKGSTGQQEAKSNTVLLTGGATSLTLNDMGCPSKAPTTNPELEKATVETQDSSLDVKDNCRLLKNVDYMVIPDHGIMSSDIRINENFKAKKGYVFSAPVKSAYINPSSTFVLDALELLKADSSPATTNLHLIYMRMKNKMTINSIQKKLEGTLAELALCFSRKSTENTTNAVGDENSVDEKRDPDSCFLYTTREIYVTGVSGDIVCDAESCKPAPILSESNQSADICSY